MQSDLKGGERMILVNCELVPQKELRLNHTWTNPRWIVKREYLKENGEKVMINDTYMYRLRAMRAYNTWIQQIESISKATMTTTEIVRELVYAAITGGDTESLWSDIEVQGYNKAEIERQLKDILSILDLRYKR